MQILSTTMIRKECFVGKSRSSRLYINCHSGHRIHVHYRTRTEVCYSYNFAAPDRHNSITALNILSRGLLYWSFTCITSHTSHFVTLSHIQNNTYFCYTSAPYKCVFYTWVLLRAHIWNFGLFLIDGKYKSVILKWHKQALITTCWWMNFEANKR